MAYRLLLADDSVTIQKVVELTFSDEDFAIVAVGDGNVAYEKIRATKPDIILSDVIMPGLNGYDLCAKVKQDPQLRGIPFLFLKGTFESFDEERAMAVGSDGFIMKPFESQELISRVKELVAKAQAAAAAPAPAPAPAVSAAPIPPPPPPVEVDLGIEAEPTLGEFAEEPTVNAFEGLESFTSEFSGFGDTIAEPAVAEPAAEEDLWSEVKITDHPIPPATPGPTAQEAFTGPEFPAVDQGFMEEVMPQEPPPAAVEPARPALVPEMVFPAAPVTAATPSVSADLVERILASSIEEVIREIAPDIIREVTRRVISDVVWEVLPEAAERLITKEIDRLTGGAPR